MAKCPNGKIIKSLYLKITYVWVDNANFFTQNSNQLQQKSFIWLIKELPMVYYPHRGEDLSPWQNLQPSPVLLVERIKTLRNEPW